MQIVFFCPNKAMCTMLPGPHLLERLTGGGGKGTLKVIFFAVRVRSMSQFFGHGFKVSFLSFCPF